MRIEYVQSGGLVSDLLAPQLESSCQPPASASARVRGWTWKWPKVVWKEGQDWAARLADEGCNILTFNFTPCTHILLPAKTQLRGNSNFILFPQLHYCMHKSSQFIVLS